MINLNFAPNESIIQGLKALSALMQPWNWYRSADETQLSESLHQLHQNTYSNQLQTGFAPLFLSARSSLKILLESLNLPVTSAVLLQGFTCEAVVLPILTLDLTPIYVEIELDTLSMNGDSLQQKISPQTKVLILQHTFGMTPHDRTKIIQLAQQHQILVIEDLAHGFHPTIFTDEFTDTTIKLFSFGRSKLFSAVHGGALYIPPAVLTQFSDLQSKIIRRLDQLPYPSSIFTGKTLLYKIIAPIIKHTYPLQLGKVLHFISKELSLFTHEVTDQEKQGQYDPWLEKRMPGVLARFATADLLSLNQSIKKRLTISNYYQQQLATNFSSLPILRFPLHNSLTTNKINTDLITKALAKQNILVGNWYQQVVAPSELQLEAVNYQRGSCLVAEQLTDGIINLPLSISRGQAERIVQIIKSTYV